MAVEPPAPKSYFCVEPHGLSGVQSQRFFFVYLYRGLAGVKRREPPVACAVSQIQKVRLPSDICFDLRWIDGPFGPPFPPKKMPAHRRAVKGVRLIGGKITG